MLFETNSLKPTCRKDKARRKGELVMSATVADISAARFSCRFFAVRIGLAEPCHGYAGHVTDLDVADLRGRVSICSVNADLCGVLIVR